MSAHARKKSAQQRILKPGLNFIILLCTKKVLSKKGEVLLCRSGASHPKCKRRKERRVVGRCRLLLLLGFLSFFFLSSFFWMKTVSELAASRRRRCVWHYPDRLHQSKITRIAKCLFRFPEFLQGVNSALSAARHGHNLPRCFAPVKKRWFEPLLAVSPGPRSFMAPGFEQRKRRGRRRRRRRDFLLFGGR